MFGRGRRSREQAAPRARGHATVVGVGKSNANTPQQAAVVKVRLHVEVAGLEPYDTTNPWQVELGSLGKLTEGARVAVEVDTARPLEVHPLVGWAQWSVLYATSWTR